MSEEPTERLYFIGAGTYVQWNGTADEPEQLVRYRSMHADHLPAYMPLPAGPAVFLLNQGMLEVRWSGEGPLPERVLEYVKREGVLPATKGLTTPLGLDMG